MRAVLSRYTVKLTKLRHSRLKDTQERAHSMSHLYVAARIMFILLVNLDLPDEQG